MGGKLAREAMPETREGSLYWGVFPAVWERPRPAREAGRAVPSAGHSHASDGIQDIPGVALTR